MNIIAINESNENEIIGFYHDVNHKEAIRSAIEKFMKKQNYGQGQGFSFNYFLKGFF